VVPLLTGSSRRPSSLSISVPLLKSWVELYFFDSVSAPFLGPHIVDPPPFTVEQKNGILCHPGLAILSI